MYQDVLLYMVVLLATDEPFYPDIVLFPIYLDHPVSLKNIFHCVWHTNRSLHISTGCIPMPSANKNTRAKEVPYKRLTRPSQYDCCAMHIIFGMIMFAEICRRSKLLARSNK